MKKNYTFPGKFFYVVKYSVFGEKKTSKKVRKKALKSDQIFHFLQKKKKEKKWKKIILFPIIFFYVVKYSVFGKKKCKKKIEKSTQKWLNFSFFAKKNGKKVKKNYRLSSFFFYVVKNRVFGKKNPVT